MTKKRTCLICGFDVPKGSQYFTIKTAKSTTRILFAMCEDHGEKMQDTLNKAFLAFVRVAGEERDKAKENAKND